MANGAYGGYVTAATIQNTGSAPAIVRIAYFDQNGAPVGTGDSISSLPVNASWTVRQDNGNSFPSSGGRRPGRLGGRLQQPAHRLLRQRVRPRQRG